MRSARVRSLLGITTEDLQENENLHSVRENQRKSKHSNRHSAAENDTDNRNAST